MWPAALLAMVVAGPRAAPRPVLRADPQLRRALVQPVTQRVPETVRRVEAQDGNSSLARVLNGLEFDGPVVLKPEFQGGPGAAIAFRF